MPFLIYCNSPLSLPVIYQNARFTILKPRCACTGVVLWLNDPPNMSIKVERQLHDMRMLDRIVGVRST